MHRMLIAEMVKQSRAGIAQGDCRFIPEPSSEMLELAMVQLWDDALKLRATLAERDAEIAALKHDIARHVSICADQEAEIAALKAELFDEQMKGEAIRIIREPLKRVGIASAFAIDLGEMAACEIEWLRAEREQVRAAMQAMHPDHAGGMTNEEFARLWNATLGLLDRETPTPAPEAT